MDIDIFSSGYRNFVNYCESMPAPIFMFVAKAAMILIMPLILTRAAIAQGSTSKVLQSISVLLGILLAAASPVPDLDRFPQAKAWIFAVCLLAIFSLPAVIPKDVIDGLAIQKRAVWLIYSLFLFLFLMQLLGEAL